MFVCLLVSLLNSFCLIDCLSDGGRESVEKDGRAGRKVRPGERPGGPQGPGEPGGRGPSPTAGCSVPAKKNATKWPEHGSKTEACGVNIALRWPQSGPNTISGWAGGVES